MLADYPVTRFLGYRLLLVLELLAVLATRWIGVGEHLQTFDEQERQAQVADAGQQAVQRHLVNDRPGQRSDGWTAVAAGYSDSQVIEPGGPASIEPPLYLDYIYRWLIEPWSLRIVLHGAVPV